MQEPHSHHLSRSFGKIGWRTSSTSMKKKQMSKNNLETFAASNHSTTAVEIKDSEESTMFLPDSRGW